MEITKRISQLDPREVELLERLFGQRLDASAEIVLRTRELARAPALKSADAELPEWFNVLEGLTDEELADFKATLDEPVYLARRSL
ncbi:MAG: hypothetical protein K8T25_11805 [Planctomycetia bacterium]|nr:hypothetical protein [Planctomycetia bacterium]